MSLATTNLDEADRMLRAALAAQPAGKEKTDDPNQA
jgi:hypothetical protein